MGWEQRPDGTMVFVDATGTEKTYGTPSGQPSVNSPYARALSGGNQSPSGMVGFGSGMAPTGAGQTRAAADNRIQATAGPPPDGWSGWKLGGNGWYIPKGMEGEHDMWVAGEQAKAAAAAAAAGQPTMDDMRAEGFGNENIADNRMPTPVEIEQARIEDARRTRDAALADQRRVLEATLGLAIDPVEQSALRDRYFERGLGMANTVAANARGGAGAAAAARMQVNQQMPSMMGQAAEQARAEELAAFQQRIAKLNTAAGIASTIGQTASTAFGQEQSLATDSAKLLLSAIGMQVDADIQQQAQLGAMLTSLEQLGLQYDTLDVQTQLRVFDQIAQANNIDNQIAGQIKAAAEANKKGVMDYVMGFLGAGEKVAGAASGLGWTPLA